MSEFNREDPANYSQNWIQTHSGEAFDLQNPAHNAIKIEDIAHALSQICRYTGHTSKFYSVAQHSLMVSHIVNRLGGDIQEQLHGLLHDAQEAYVNDIASPFKVLLPYYQTIERGIEVRIATKFGLSMQKPERVRKADTLALLIERSALFDRATRPWSAALEEIDITPYEDLVDHIKKIDSEGMMKTIEVLFLDAFCYFEAISTTDLSGRHNCG